MSLYGRYQVAIEKGNRFEIPTHFLEELGEIFYLCPSMKDKSLWIIPSKVFEDLIQGLRDNIPKTDVKGQRFFRDFLSMSIQLSSDENYIEIGKHLMIYAGIKGNGSIQVFGKGDYIEIWAREIWEEINEIGLESN